jgi:uncharacterized protein YceK
MKSVWIFILFAALAGCGSSKKATQRNSGKKALPEYLKAMIMNINAEWLNSFL